MRTSGTTQTRPARRASAGSRGRGWIRTAVAWTGTAPLGAPSVWAPSVLARARLSLRAARAAAAAGSAARPRRPDRSHALPPPPRARCRRGQSDLPTPARRGVALRRPVRYARANSRLRHRLSSAGVRGQIARYVGRATRSEARYHDWSLTNPAPSAHAWAPPPRAEDRSTWAWRCRRAACAG